MNVQELYDELKAALDYFDLNWKDKEEVDVVLDPDANSLVFKHGRTRAVILRIPVEKPAEEEER